MDTTCHLQQQVFTVLPFSSGNESSILWKKLRHRRDNFFLPMKCFHFLSSSWGMQRFLFPAQITPEFPQSIWVLYNLRDAIDIPGCVCHHASCIVTTFSTEMFRELWVLFFYFSQGDRAPRSLLNTPEDCVMEENSVSTFCYHVTPVTINFEQIISLQKLWCWKPVCLYFNYINAWHMDFQYLVIQFLLDILYFVVAVEDSEYVWYFLIYDWCCCSV